MRASGKKWRWHVLIACICLLIAIAALYRSMWGGLDALVWGISIPSSPLLPMDDTDHEKKLGIYDPHGDFNDSKVFGFEHIFVDWTSHDSEKLKTALSEAISRGRWPMLTIEPYPYNRTPAQAKALFTDIQEGKFDGAILRLCENIDSVGHPLFIRWGHEMENVNRRYPWAQQDEAGYVRSYRHFVDLCRRLLSTDSYFVWSPVGHKELFRYWPGSDYVDYVGVSIYGFPEYDLRNYGRRRSFENIFSEVYERVSLFEKPIMIAELGVTGEERYQRDWMLQAFRSFSKYPKLKAAVYFSAKDSPLAWGSDYSVPNWRISQAVFRSY